MKTDTYSSKIPSKSGNAFSFFQTLVALFVLARRYLIGVCEPLSLSKWFSPNYWFACLGGPE